jgi:hypothetical protein
MVGLAIVVMPIGVCVVKEISRQSLHNPLATCSTISLDYE